MFACPLWYMYMVFIQDPIRWSPLIDVVDGYSPTLPHLKGLQNRDTATSTIKQVKSAQCFSLTNFAEDFYFHLVSLLLRPFSILCVERERETLQGAVSYEYIINNAGKNCCISLRLLQDVLVLQHFWSMLIN